MIHVNNFWCIMKYSSFPIILGFWGNSKFLNSKLYGVMKFFQGIGKSMKIAQIALFYSALYKWWLVEYEKSSFWLGFSYSHINCTIAFLLRFLLKKRCPTNFGRSEISIDPILRSAFIFIVVTYFWKLNLLFKTI